MILAANISASTVRRNFNSAVMAFSSLLLIGTTPIPVEAKAPKNEPNCGKQKIRRDGIRKPTHGLDMYLYPDASQINEQYSGCQNIWLEDGFLLAQAKYKKGEIQNYRAWEPNSKRTLSCEYANGRLSKANPDSADCLPAEVFPLNKEGKEK